LHPSAGYKPASIHRSAWKVNSANFAFHKFSEVALIFVSHQPSPVYNAAVLTNPALHEVVGAFPSTNASAHATQRSPASPGAQPRGAGFAARTEEAALLT